MPIKLFLNGEDGAVTVDFVVLTAAIVGLGTGVLVSVAGGAGGLADSISGALANAEISIGPAAPTIGEYLGPSGSFPNVVYSYQMSNGEVWTMTEQSSGGAQTWKNADGDVVDAPAW